MVLTRSRNKIFKADFHFSFLNHGDKSGHDSTLANYNCFYKSETDSCFKWNFNTTCFEFRREAQINIKISLVPTPVNDCVQSTGGCNTVARNIQQPTPLHNNPPSENRVKAEIVIQLLAKNGNGQLYILRSEKNNFEFLPSRNIVRRWYYDIDTNEIPENTMEFTVKIHQEYQHPQCRLT